MQTTEKNCKGGKASKNNGFLQLANQLAEEFARRSFKGQHLAILLMVARQTYGYQGDVYAYTPGQMAEATGIDVSDVRKHVRALVSLGVLREKDGGLGINPVIDQWEIPLRGEGKSPSAKQGKSPRLKGEIPLKNEGKSPSFMESETASGAAIQAPKEKKESIKENNPPTPPEGEVGRRVPFLNVLREADWLEGEQAKVLAMFKRDRLEDMTIGLGPLGEDKIRDFLAVPANLRRPAWENLEAAQAEGLHVRKPLKWLMDFIADPTHFPEIKKPEPAGKVVDLAVAKARKPWQWMYEGKGTFDDVSWAWDRAQIVGRWLDREYDWRVIRPMAKEKGLDAVLEMLHNDLEPLRQEQARKKAAQVNHG